jgi:hypothetical protein
VGFAALAGAVALSRSATPAVLGRYSTTLFAYQLVNLAALGLLVAPKGRGLGYALVVVSTFVAPVNEAVRQWPAVQLLLPALRGLAAWALVAAEFDRFRATRRARGLVVSAAVALACLSALDLALYARVAATTGFDEDYEGYRDRYDLAAVTPDDVVIAGDSFVWGHGVAKPQRFGNVLERLYADEGRRVRVFSLGVRGAGPDRYVASLDRVPAGKRLGVAVFSFYPNDIAPRPKPRAQALVWAETTSWTLGRSSLTFRVLHDALGMLEAPSLDAYHASLVADFRPDDPSFPRRRAALLGSMESFARLAREHSDTRPLFLLIPLLVDFSSYPLISAHADLRAAAEALGFDVLDLTPAFRNKLGDGRAYRVRPGDNHFDARVHALVAALIKEHLDARPDTTALGRSQPPDRR